MAAERSMTLGQPTPLFAGAANGIIEIDRSGHSFEDIAAVESLQQRSFGQRTAKAIGAMQE